MNEIINDASSLDIHKLAFVGDAVYELVVREKIACKFNYNIGELNKVKVNNVCCKAQSDFFETIKDILTPEELEIYKRGRNFRVKTIPKSASACEYHRATGVESLFGYWFLNKDFKRIIEISSKINL